METLFLKRDATEETRERCRAIIDEWSVGIPFSPIKRLGTDSDFVAATELAAYHTTIQTQVEERQFSDHEVPYRGQELPAQARTKTDYDLWKIDFRPFADFQSHDTSLELKDTRRKFECPRCHGVGDIDCDGCAAHGWLACRPCSATGWVAHSPCGGQGQIKRTRKVAHKEKCGCRGAANCPRCRGSQIVVVETKETYYEPCPLPCRRGQVRCTACPEREGEVRCPKCGGRRIVECPRCRRCKQVMTSSTAERRERPKVNSKQYCADGLPGFTKTDNPTSKLGGPVVFTQDEPGRIAAFNLAGHPAAEVLTAHAESCRAGHSGHILRQRLEVQRCSLVHYRYRYAGSEYSIYLNPAHKLIEDSDGPIQAAISNTDTLAAAAYRERRYEDAYRLVTRALCMDEATPSERDLRDRILRGLMGSYAGWSLLSWGVTGGVWMMISAAILRASVLTGVLASILPLALGVHLFGRDLGVRVANKRVRIAVALQIGLIAALSAAAMHEPLPHWPSHWSQNLSLAIVTLGLVFVLLDRSKERARRCTIEDHIPHFRSTEKLEAYVASLDADRSWQRRTQRWLVGIVGALFVTAFASIYATYAG